MASVGLFNDHHGIDSDKCFSKWSIYQEEKDEEEVATASLESSNITSPSSTSLEWLPIDIIYRIFSCCNNSTLAALSGTCRRLYQLVNDDYVWRARSQKALVTNGNSRFFATKCFLDLKNRDKCILEASWKRGLFHETILLHNKKPLIPWLSIESRYLWCAQGNTLYKYHRFKDGRISSKPLLSLKNHQDDILKVKVRDNIIVSGSLDGSISTWNKFTGHLIAKKPKAHESVINSIDCFHEKLVITGSKDRTVRLWSLDWNPIHPSRGLTSCQTVYINDRVLSVAANESRNLAVIGSAGCASKKPLYIYDIASNKLVSSLNDEHRHGAGVLDALWEDESTLLSCGYDTLIRLWDIRDTSNGKCVLKWEDPHDSAIYCLVSDKTFTILSGTCRYGVVRLWDKRNTKRSIQMYYVRCENSPVYALDFDPCFLYVALDKSINLLAFRGYQSTQHCQLI